jgi:hypothetical protein
MDLLDRAAGWLADKLRSYASRSVTYARGSSVVTVSAVIGRTVFRIDKGYGFMERIEARDYLVNSTDLVLDTTVTLPKAGDRVEETAGGKVYTYEVMAPGGEPCWRFSDPYRKVLRIHTKLVNVEDAP